MEKFPDHIDTSLVAVTGPNSTCMTSPTRQPAYTNGATANTLVPQDRWRAAGTRTENGNIASPNRGASCSPSPHGGRLRQKSISEAWRTVRTRHGSVSQNAQEIADALRAPLSPKLVILCVMWYTSSALTNTSSKSILNAFDKPATLTLIQFALVSSFCLISSWLAGAFPVLRTRVAALKHPIRSPTRQVLTTTLPLAAFQIAGHLLSSKATAKIPVSLVHTIKGLSPLFTVFAYRVIYDIRYPTTTYLSLIPLICGIMLACSGKHGFGGELLGVIYALLAAIIFVTQNIFSKKLFNEAAKAESESSGAQSRKLDKLNLLCYSSGLAFVLTIPIWFWSEGIGIIRDIWHDGSIGLSSGPGSFDRGRLAVEFLFNGTFHWGQNILAFILLSMVSPVTYSVASLIKRVFVIIMAIIWFRSPTTPAQAAGIALTFLGLYLYDRTSDSNKADRKARMISEPDKAPLLPVNGRRSLVLKDDEPKGNGDIFSAGPTMVDKKSDDTGKGGNPAATWLAPGTRQEYTWRAADRQAIGV